MRGNYRRQTPNTGFKRKKNPPGHKKDQFEQRPSGNGAQRKLVI